MEGMHILVTGGAGLIGSHTIDQLLLQRPAKITIVDNLTRGRLENLSAALPTGKVDLVQGDVRDEALLGRLMPDVDLVFHLAAIRITHCAAEPRLAHDVLGTGTFNVLEAAVKAGVKKVVAASSASVYGLAQHFPTPETDNPYDNRTLYGALKVYNEGLLRSYHAMHGLDYVALRYFNVYGSRMDIHGAYTEVLIRWMDRLIAGQPPLIHGDGEQTMDFIYVEDIARANVLAMLSSATDTVLNIASGTETSLNQLAAALGQVMGNPLAPTYGPARAVNPVSRRLAATVAAREQINFTAEIPLHEGLRRLAAWWAEEKRKSV
ncbi:NAD-dependent epimerase/dehydratase family protein [Opitutus sp. GAS368]|uniref:NAD-dependent epimerase/dehydratase family protein n=1 Tax=Opitutus sp. GAS368 TaxID=1882749 RepID=UPI000B813592